MLKLLLDVVTKEDAKTYLNMAAEIPGGPLCLHLAAQYRQVEMIKFLKQLSKDKEWKGVLSLDCRNGKNETAMEIAVLDGNYQVCKALFNPKADNREFVNNLVNICLRSKDEYDKDNPTKCRNYLWFKQLLRQKGVRVLQIYSTCLESKRTEYFELSVCRFPCLCGVFPFLL